MIPASIISSVRFGFATNSSSTHSIVVLGDDGVRTERYDGAGEFGWDNFVLADKQSKDNYAIATYACNIDHVVGAGAERSALIEQKFGRGGEFYIDHQSVLCLPKSKWNDLPDEEFCDVGVGRTATSSRSKWCSARYRSTKSCGSPRSANAST